MKKPMLFSMPNSMTDWVMRCITTVHPRMYYKREEYHPGQLGKPVPDLAARAKASSFAMGKECLHVWNMEKFAEVYNLFVLVPTRELNWPPNRQAMLRLYLNIYDTMLQRGELEPTSEKSDRLCATQAWWTYRNMLMEKACTLNLPTIYTPSLMNLDALNFWLPQQFNAVQIHRTIVSTYDPKLRPAGNSWERADTYLDELERSEPRSNSHLARQAG